MGSYLEYTAKSEQLKLQRFHSYPVLYHAIKIRYQQIRPLLPLSSAITSCSSNRITNEYLGIAGIRERDLS